MYTTIIATVLALFPPVFDPAQSACNGQPLTQATSEASVLQAFGGRIDAYMNAHNQVEQQLAPQRVFDDPEDLFDAMHAMRAGIRAARRDARPGSVFTADVGALIRTRLQQRLAVCNYTVEEVLAFLNAERLPAPAPRINGRFPWSVGSAMWPTLLAVLPPLPEELQYRFVDRDLVLVDIHANLVVDILENALPGRKR